MKDLDTLTRELYSCISFSKGAQPDLQKLRTLFYSTARLINNNDTKPLDFTVEQFIDAVRQQLENGELEAFQEREIAARTEVFGNIAHRFSTYEAGLEGADARSAIKGINSIQFIKVAGKWLVSAMVWNDEAENRKIPQEYL